MLATICAGAVLAACSPTSPNSSTPGRQLVRNPSPTQTTTLEANDAIMAVLVAHMPVDALPADLDWNALLQIFSKQQHDSFAAAYAKIAQTAPPAQSAMTGMLVAGGRAASAVTSAPQPYAESARITSDAWSVTTSISACQPQTVGAKAVLDCVVTSVGTATGTSRVSGGRYADSFRIAVDLCPDAAGLTWGKWDRHITLSADVADMNAHVSYTTDGTADLIGHVDDAAELGFFDLANLKIRLYGSGHATVNGKITNQTGSNVKFDSARPVTIHESYAGPAKDAFIQAMDGVVGSLKSDLPGRLGDDYVTWFAGMAADLSHDVYRHASRAWRNGECIDLTADKGSKKTLAVGDSARFTADATHKFEGKKLKVPVDAKSSHGVVSPSGSVNAPAEFTFVAKEPSKFSGDYVVDLKTVSKRGIAKTEVKWGTAVWTLDFDTTLTAADSRQSTVVHARVVGMKIDPAHPVEPKKDAGNGVSVGGIVAQAPVEIVSYSIDYWDKCLGGESAGPPRYIPGSATFQVLQFSVSNYLGARLLIGTGYAKATNPACHNGTMELAGYYEPWCYLHADEAFFGTCAFTDFNWIQDWTYTEADGTYQKRYERSTTVSSGHYRGTFSEVTTIRLTPPQ